MSDFCKTFRTFQRDERGATAIEYGLVGLLISVTIIAAASQLGQAIVPFFEFVSTKVKGVKP